MCAKLHVWRRRTYDGARAGHAALELSDGTYVSWRRNMVTHAQGDEGPELSPTAYEDDCNFEGRPPDRSYLIIENEMDESLVKRWWQNWQTSRAWKRQGEITPCFTVLEGVMAGQGWFRREGGVELDLGELVDQVTRLGVIKNGSCSIQ